MHIVLCEFIFFFCLLHFVANTDIIIIINLCNFYTSIYQYG